MLIPYSVDVPMERWPFTNWALIAITCVISIGILIDPPRSDRWTVEKDAPGAPVIERVFLDELEGVSSLALNPRHFSFLQLFTCVFVHGDLFHLIGNMIFLFVFGNAVNAKMGHIPFLLSYFLLGALASCAWLLLGNGQPAVGASGAIMGIVGLFLVFFPRNDVTILYWFSFYFSGTFDLSSMWIILSYLAGDLFGSLTAGGGGGVAYVAHLGGALGGIACGVAAIQLGWFAATPYEVNLLQLLGWQEKTPRKKKKKKRRVAIDDD
jgi:membrane associated rhomboid family serine protease